MAEPRGIRAVGATAFNKLESHGACSSFGKGPGMTQGFVRSIRACAITISFVASLLVASGASGVFAQSSTPTTITKQTITLDAANTAVDASLTKARELGVLAVVAVYDESEMLKALASMDGARYTGLEFALNKAYTAVRRQAATQDLADAQAGSPEFLWHSFLKHPRLTLQGGGIPIIVSGQVVAGLGVSGGTIPQDIEIASAGVVAIER
jgi:uncharacterized protein GlcG (DUF336 family)